MKYLPRFTVKTIKKSQNTNFFSQKNAKQPHTHTRFVYGCVVIHKKIQKSAKIVKSRTFIPFPVLFSTNMRYIFPNDTFRIVNVETES